MTQPTPYDRQANFTNEETLNPTGKTPGVSLDSEFNRVKLTLDETLGNLAMIQRDDGALKNGIVTADALSDSLSIGFTLRGEWETGVNYLANDGVYLNSRFYRASVGMISTTANIQNPGGGGPWVLVADFTASLDAQASADAAAASAALAASVINSSVTQAVRWDVDQSLTDPQKARARQNIGASGGRNLLINGSFRVNQRGFAGGALAAGAYGHDRWKAGSGGASYSVAAGVATIASGSIVQVIEGLSIEFTETFIINWTGTATCTVDGVARAKGATFTLTAGTNATVEFTGGTVSKPQIEAGTATSDFERRAFSSELALCQRYFEAIGGGLAASQVQYVATGAAASATQFDGFLQFGVAKRATPTVTFPGTTANFLIQTKVSSPVVSGTPIVLTNTAKSTGLGLRYPSTGLVAGDGGFMGMQLDAAIWIDAEL